jgi:hypothetical protein
MMMDGSHQDNDNHQREGVYLGYWGPPHSSSVDFCESNYRFTRYIVEPHNVWSSLLGIAWFGALGLWQTFGRQQQPKHQQQLQPHPLTEWRLRMAFAVLLWIGFGSAGLHGTLHWIFQSSDELPMLYICLCEIYCMANVSTATAVVDDRSSSSSSWLAPFLVVVAMVTTVFYYVYQDLYWVFLVTFAIGSIMTVIGFVRLALFVKRRRPDTLRLFYGAVIAYGVVATPVWILDMVMCDYGVLELANHYWFGMTPHVVWHFCAGYATYCGLLFLTACRCEELGRPFQVDFWCGGLCPVMMAVSPFSSAAAKQK